MTSDVAGVVRRFRRESRIERVYIVGSHARGTARPDSDIDLVLVDPRFVGKRAFERPLGLRRFWPRGVPVDFICLTPAEFEAGSRKPTMARVALEEGVPIV